MSGTFSQLVSAILADDCAKVKSLVKNDPGLATFAMADADCLEDRILHWIYTSDTGLHVAAAGYRVEIARMMLAAGADVATVRNRRCSQPLHYASDGHPDSLSWNPTNQVATINLLLKAGAPINAQDKNGATPLHRAVRTRCAAAVNCLLEAGADYTIRNLPGSTPFHLAVQNTGRGGSGSEQAHTAQREILRAFLKRGASPMLPDGKEKTVLDRARSGWVRELLVKAEA